MTFVNTSPRAGSYDSPLQFPPPSVLGNITIVASVRGGVNMLVVNILFVVQRSRQ